MSADSPLQISLSLLLALGTRIYLHHEDRLPQGGAVLVVSNHRSFMDAPLLMGALGYSIRFACHHYMSQVPIMREIVEQLGCFPLDAIEQRQQSFFQKATRLLQSRQVVGVFPEGGEPMVNFIQPNQLGEFHRGFAHLALRAPVADLAVLPVAISPIKESVNSVVPLRLLKLFDPSEPLFDQEGWHPMVIYQRVDVLVGRPHWITASERQRYRGKEARKVVTDLTDHCCKEISHLIDRGY